MANLKSCAAYQDDILIWSSSGQGLSASQSHSLNLFKVLHRLFCMCLIPSWYKCNFGEQELEWCGRLITKEGIKSTTKKASTILNLAIPKNYDQARSFFHMMVWHSQFIPKFGEIMFPITEVICKGKSKVPFKIAWSKETTKAFEHVKSRLAKSVELSRDGKGDLHLFSDASCNQVGGHLVRIDQSAKHLMGYYSHTLSVKESEYSTPKKELYAIYQCCKHWRRLVSGRKFVIHTDAKSWEGLNLKNPKGIIAWWLMEILGK